MQHSLVGFYNLVEVCLLRGTDWIFKENGVSLLMINLSFSLGPFS